MHPALTAVVHDRGAAASLGALRAALDEAGGPLREARNDGDVDLTFVWIGEAPSVALHCGLVDHGGRGMPMQRLDEAPVWYLVATAPPDLLVSYRYVVDDPFARAGAADEASWVALMIEAHGRSFADPHNARSIPALGVLFGLDRSSEHHESILALPEAPPAPWFDASLPTPPLDAFTLDSRAMGSTRTITVQTTPGAAAAPLVVLLDGRAWIELAGLPAAIDAAVAAGELAPVVVAYVHEADGGAGLVERTAELSCNPAHARMLVDELLPVLRAMPSVDPSPAATVLGGTSLGGLAACATAMEHPGSVGQVLSISGSYWYGTERDGLPEWIARRMAIEPRRPFRMYQQIGRLEDAPLALSPGVSHLVANRHLRDVALAKGHEVHYEELATAHDIAAFRVAAMRGLIALLPGRRAG